MDSEGEKGNAEACQTSEEKATDKTKEILSDIIMDERKETQSIYTDKEEKKRGRKSRAETMKLRERSNSASILEYMTGNKIENEINISKRKREEMEREAELVFKRSNKLERSPLKEKNQVEETKRGEGAERTEEEEKKTESRVLIEMLKEIKTEMVEMRKEMKEVKDKMYGLEEGWDAREKRMTERMDVIEIKVNEIEKKKREEKEENKNREEEIIARMMETWKKKEKIIELQERKTIEETKNEVKKLKGIIEGKEKKERKNNIVIRGLRKDRKDIIELGTDFLEKEFGARERIKHIKTEGKEGREVVIVEMEDWQAKEKIMKEKNKLRGRNIFIDHDMTKEEREVQRKLREMARGEKGKGKRVKIGYRKIIIEGKVFVWNEKEEELREKENFEKAVMMMR